MSIDMEPGDVAGRLRDEFDRMGVRQGLETSAVVAAGRRRRRARVLTAAAASVALVAALAAAGPIALNAVGGERTDTASERGQPLTWTHCGPPARKKDANPPDRRLWLGSITDKRLRPAAEAAIAKAIPGAKVEFVFVSRGCPFMESGAEVVFNIVRADGVKASIQADISGELGTPAERADKLMRTRKRSGIPDAVPPGKPMEQRLLDGGVHAVVYPKGLDFWSFPVDLFGAGNTNVTVSAGPYRGPTGDKLAPEPNLDGTNTPIPVAALLAVGKAVSKLAPTSRPGGPVKVVDRCLKSPPKGHEKLTMANVDAVLRRELLKIAPGSTVTRGIERGECWTSPSAAALTGAGPLDGSVEVALVARGAGRNAAVLVTVALRDGTASVRAGVVSFSGDRARAGFRAPMAVDRQHRGDKTDLGGGLHGVVYPKGAGFWRLPLDVFAPSGANIGVYASDPSHEETNLTPEKSPLTNAEMVQIAKAIAALEK